MTVKVFVHAVSTEISGKPREIHLTGIAENEKGEKLKERIPGTFQFMDDADKAARKWKKEAKQRLGG